MEWSIFLLPCDIELISKGNCFESIVRVWPCGDLLCTYDEYWQHFGYLGQCYYYIKLINYVVIYLNLSPSSSGQYLDKTWKRDTSTLLLSETCFFTGWKLLIIQENLIRFIILCSKQIDIRMTFKMFGMLWWSRWLSTCWWYWERVAQFLSLIHSNQISCLCIKPDYWYMFLI